MKTIQFNGFKSENAQDGKWFTFYSRWKKCSLVFEPWWYFDERPVVHGSFTTLLLFTLLPLSFYNLWFLLSLIFIRYSWGQFFLHLPYSSGKTDECDSPRYGFYFDCTDSPELKLFDYLVICLGNKSKYIYMPWSFKWYRTSIKLKPQKTPNEERWEHEFKGDKKDFYKDKWIYLKETFNYNYKDSYDGKIIPTKITVEQREWRRRCLMWTSLFNMIRTTINIEFYEEVGREKGSWKGGCTGCSYELLSNETPLECIQRMEKERKF